MLRLKIGFTVFAIYEIIIVMILNNATMCRVIGTLCMPGPIKYFIWCFAVPTLIFLLVMWLHELIAPRRRSVMYRAKTILDNITSDVRDDMARTFTPENVSKYLSMAISALVSKYVTAQNNKTLEKPKKKKKN